MTQGPLRDIRILDLTHVWAGPLAVRFLADLGAQVVKVEAATARGPVTPSAGVIGGWLGGEPGSDPWNRNAAYAKLERNRRSLCIDLKSAEGKAAFLKLVASTDVLVENFSAGAMRGLGFDYETLAAANPRLVYLTISGFGASGPNRDRVAYGPVIEGMCGLTQVLGYDDEQLFNTAMALMDPIAATNATAAVMTALRRREHSGKGALVEMSLHEGGVTYSAPWLVDEQLGNSPVPMGNRHPALAPHGVFRCKGHDQWVAIACRNDKEWRALCVFMCEQANDPGANDCFDVDATLEQRLTNADAIELALTQWTTQYSKEDAAQRLQAGAISAGPVNTTPDMVNDAQVVAREFFVNYEAFDTPMPGNPIKMAGLSSADWTPSAKLGADNAAVLQDWLGYSVEQVTALEAGGVIASRPPE